MAEFHAYDLNRNLVAGKVLRDKNGLVIFDDEGRAYAIPETFDFQAALNWGASLRDKPVNEKLRAIKSAFETEGGFLDVQRSRDGKPGGLRGESVATFQASASYAAVA